MGVTGRFRRTESPIEDIDLFLVRTALPPGKRDASACCEAKVVFVEGDDNIEADFLYFRVRDARGGESVVPPPPSTFDEEPEAVRC